MSYGWEQWDYRELDPNENEEPFNVDGRKDYPLEYANGWKAGPTKVGPYYEVDMPHQCDDWVIAKGPDKAKVLEAMHAFAADVAAAIKEMEDLR